MKQGVTALAGPVVRPLGELRRFHGFGEQEALRGIAADALQQVEFVGRLDSLGDRLQAEATPKIKARFENRTQVRIAGGAGHERAIDLQFIEWNARQLLH